MHLQNPYPIFSENVDEKIFQKLKNLPIKERLRCIALHYQYQEKQKLDQELQERINKLKQKSEEISIDIVKSQNMILSGEQQKLVPFLDKIEKYLTAEEKEEKENREQKFKEENQKYNQELLYNIKDNNGRRGYWQKVIKNCKSLYQKFDVKADMDLLYYLQKVNYERDLQLKTLTLSFYFDLPYEQPIAMNKLKYFPDKQPIKKIFQFLDNVNPIKSTFSGSFKLKAKNKNSFVLNFFEDNKNLEDIKESNKKEDKEQNQKIFSKLAQDYEVALIFIEELIPYSLEYYLGIRGEYPHEPKPIKLNSQEDQQYQNNENNDQDDCQIY